MIRSARRVPNRCSVILRVVVVCVALIACSNLDVPSTTPPDSTPNVAASQTPAPPSIQSVLRPTSTDCSGETEPPIVASGWKLLWQRMFDQPIARPPEIAESQLIILERANPLPGEFKDSVWVLDPQTATTEWRFEGANGNPDLPVRWVRDLTWSQNYVALHVQYQDRGLFSFTMPESYLFVLDRASGELVHSIQSGIHNMALLDKALYYRSDLGEFRRIDLLSKTQRWSHSGNSHELEAFIPLGSRLYSVGDDQKIYQYNILDGTRVATATLKLVAILEDVQSEGDTLVIRSSYQNQEVMLFDLNSFSARWFTPVSYPDHTETNAFWGYVPSMTVSHDSIFLFDSHDNLLRLDLATGKPLWSRSSAGVEPLSRPAVIGELVYGLFADGTLRAFSKTDGSHVNTAMNVPVWYWTRSDKKEFRDLVGGLGVSGDTLIVTTGCRSAYAIQRVQ